ncbi:MAG: hypothetical protein VR65_17730 [Desulfobulbaceae bacterium BRH_c16a]|nr:MAG: hypothetical protein VR65_17730 [Desulfobulbaceae bacterium BRH_c16a]
MFSSRLPAALEPNDFTRILQAKKAAGAKILDLTQSNPTHAGFSYDFLQRDGICTRIRGRYEPSAQGMQSAREAIGRYYLENGHGRIAGDDLFLTASTSEAYSFLLKLLTEPGDEVLLPAPSYPLFDFLANLESVTPVRYALQLEESGHWRIDFKSLEMMISSLTRAIVVVSPNNPTGSYMTAEELSLLNQLCTTHEIALIVDEVFLDYIKSGSLKKTFSAISNNDALTFTLSGFSKILALPQAKLSWIHVGGPEPIKEGAKHRLEFIADTYLSVSSMIQQATAPLLGVQQDIQQQILARIEVNERALKSWTDLEHCPDTCHREGGWYAILELPGEITDEECCLELLEQHSLIVHPGFFYDFAENNRIVISLICPEKEFGQGLAILQGYLDSRSPK